MSRIPNLRPSVPMLGGNVGTPTVTGWQDARRGSRHERGYGSAWDRLRLRILARDSYLCQCSDCQGGELRVRAATHVDHIISKAEWKMSRGSLEGVDHDGNLQAMNKDCHARKTAAERKRLLDHTHPRGE